MACPRMECSADRENRPWMLKRVQHDESGGRGLPPAPCPFVPVSCNSVAVTSSSSQKYSTGEPNPRAEAIFPEPPNRFRPPVSAPQIPICPSAQHGAPLHGKGQRVNTRHKLEL